MRKLFENDRNEIMKYILNEPEFNLFFIGDIENYGVDNENVEIFANELNGLYDCLILRYRESFLVYSQKDDYDAAKAADFLKTRNAGFISGKGSVLEKLIPFLTEKKAKNTYLSKLTKVEKPIDVLHEATIRPLTSEDAKSIVELFLQVEEFKEDYVKDPEKQIENVKFNLRSGQGFGAFLNGRLIATASTSAEYSLAAMIIGVATLPEYRNKGLASNLVAALCESCLQKGMQFLCLFYNNPKAGSIYRKIGFKEMGSYMLLK